MSTRKEFPNNFDAIQSSPDEYFPPIDWDDFYNWRVRNWEIPSSVACIIRAEHKQTGKITEHVYQKPAAAENRVFNYMAKNTHYVTIADHETIQLLKRHD